MKTPFDWVKEIRGQKRPVGLFSSEDWKSFDSFIINRALSMDPVILTLVNEVQLLSITDKKTLYRIYCDYVPKGRPFHKYLKAKKGVSKELLSYVVQFYEVSEREAENYILLLTKDDLKTILEKLGVEDKKIKKLLK